jgi:Na+/H+-dicarboxylate symporter
MLTAGSLGGLIAGLILGLIAFESQSATLLAGASAIEPVGNLWVNALRMIVIPLIVSHLFVAVASMGAGRTAGRLGGLSLASFVLLLVIAFAFTIALMPAVLGMFRMDDAGRALFQASAGIRPEQPAVSPSSGFVTFLTHLIPTNAFRAVVEDDILAVIVFTVVFALATARIPADQRHMVINVFRALAQATTVIVGWLLLVLPLGVFAISYALTAKTGLTAAGVLGFFVLAVSALMIAFTLLLYPLTALVARVPMRRFAWAVAPSQAVALGSRSSLASLPALMKGASERLAMNQTVSALVLPLAVSTFKVNRGISSPVKLLFLAHVYGIAIEPGFMVFFVLTVILLSFSSPGIPGGGPMLSTPVYLAAGIPLQGILLLEAVDAIPDMFKTLVNVTADMSVAATIARLAGRAVTPEAVPAMAAVESSLPAAPAGL